MNEPQTIVAVIAIAFWAAILVMVRIDSNRKKADLTPRYCPTCGKPLIQTRESPEYGAMFDKHTGDKIYDVVLKCPAYKKLYVGHYYNVIKQITVPNNEGGA